MSETQAHATLAQLQQAGIVASLPADLPLQRIVTVTDALLAAPVQAVEVRLAGETAAALAAAAALLQDVRRRGRAQLLVGAADVATPAQAAALLAAGAQYLCLNAYVPAILADCRERDVLCLPRIISLYGVEAAAAAGVRCVRVPTGGPAGPAFVQTIRRQYPAVQLGVAGTFEPTEVVTYARSGATAVFLGETLVAGPEQPLADLISRARRFRQAWLQAVQTAPGRNGSDHVDA